MNAKCPACGKIHDITDWEIKLGTWTCSKLFNGCGEWSLVEDWLSNVVEVTE